MKRSIVLAALALIQALIFGAVAAVVVVATMAPAAAQEAQRPFALPRCMPAALGGAGVGFKTIDGPDGTCHGWWCPDASVAGGWRQWQHCRIPGYGWGTLANATNELAAAAVSLESFNAFLLRTQQAPTSAGVPYYNALHAKMDAAMATTKPAPPAPPPPPAWVVDVGTDAAKLTRPAFPFVNGVRGTTSTARATSGQPCRPEVAQAPAGVAGKVFAAFGPNYSPALVALCRKP